MDILLTCTVFKRARLASDQVLFKLTQRRLETICLQPLFPFAKNKMWKLFLVRLRYCHCCISVTMLLSVSHIAVMGWLLHKSLLGPRSNLRPWFRLTCFIGPTRFDTIWEDLCPSISSSLQWPARASLIASTKLDLPCLHCSNRQYKFTLLLVISFRSFRSLPLFHLSS